MNTPKLLPVSKLTRKFLLTFFADPKKKWCVQEMENASGARCAYGHVYHACFGTVSPLESQYCAVDTKIADAFCVHLFDVLDINNGTHPDFKQRTPRARILAALRKADKEAK